MKKLFSIALAIFATAQLNAQTILENGIEHKNWCTTHKIEQYVANHPEEFPVKPVVNHPIPGVPKAQVYQIPIVFHIVHTGGPENVSEAQILNALETINEDFRLQNADTADIVPFFKPLLQDAEIEFVLATIAPNGACFRGWTRTFSTTTNNVSGLLQAQQLVNAVKAGNDVCQGFEWPGDKYLNVFVVADAGGAGGFTTKPNNPYQDEMYNGIYLLNTQFGQIGTSSPSAGRSLTHEIGHWYGLDHTWGSSNDPGLTSNCGGSWPNSDDGVADTPDCKGGTGGCNLSLNSCPTIDPYYGFDAQDNSQNYMDYFLSCQSMFTAGQVSKMRDNAGGLTANSAAANRANLWSPSNLAATGAGVFVLCDADFEADKTSVCAGDQVQFTDMSFNAVTGWTWTFPGGTPSSSTSQNPTITYSTPGTYEVTLQATDGSSNDTEVKTAYITVLDNPQNIPLLEGFENYSSLNGLTEWQVLNPQNNNTWELATVGLASSKSAYIQNYGQQSGSIDELVSGPIDLSSITGSMTLSYRYAYNRRNSSDDDYFRVLVTNDCGDSWVVRKTLHGSQLNTAISPALFTPTSDNDWITVHMTNVTSGYWVDNFRYMFRFENGGGNNIYLDNINIYSGSPSDDLVVGLDENAGTLNDLSIFPNPADDELNVQFELSNAQVATVEIRDLTGKKVQSHMVQANSGANVVSLATGELASGMYFLVLSTGGNQETVQFVVK